MQLFIATASPFVRKCRVLIREHELTDRVTEREVHTDPTTSPGDLTSVNPIGKIPALIRDDGPALYDSRVITRYLDTLGRKSLYPETRLWEVLTLEATGDAMMEAILSMVYEARHRDAAMQSADWMEAQWGKVLRAADALEGRWGGHLSGPLDMGQVSVACALGYAALRQPERDLLGSRPMLANWFEKISDRDSLRATVPA